MKYKTYVQSKHNYKSNIKYCLPVKYDQIVEIKYTSFIFEVSSKSDALGFDSKNHLVKVRHIQGKM